MENLAEIFKYTCLGTVALAALLLILLSLRGSRLGGLVFKLWGGLMMAVTGLLALYILNPMDIIPDIIPVAGQVDDLVAIITALFTGIAAVTSFLAGGKRHGYDPEALSEERPGRRLPPK